VNSVVIFGINNLKTRIGVGKIIDRVIDYAKRYFGIAIKLQQIRAVIFNSFNLYLINYFCFKTI